MIYTGRILEKAALKALEDDKILVLTGPRQTGKTTLLQKMLTDVPEDEKLFLNLDDPFLRDRLLTTDGALVLAIEDHAQKPLSSIESFHLIIDEAQKSPELFERIKALHDRHKGHIRIALTGSSSLGLHDPVAESLAGRVRQVELSPFTLLEGWAHVNGSDPRKDPLVELMSRLLTGRFTDDDFNWLANRCKWHRRKRREFVGTRMIHPLFPEPCDMETPETWLKDYLTTYLEKDIRSLAAIGNVTLYRSCLRQIAARSGGTLKWETVAQEIGTTSVTLRKYVSLLEETLNLIRLQPFAINPLTRVIKAPKVFLNDAGLTWAIRGYEDRILLEKTGMLGAFMELLTVTEIARWCSFEPTFPELRFWRKSHVSEIDLVVSNRGYHIPFEVKSGSTFKKSWLRGLDAFSTDHAAMNLAIPYRFIIYMGKPCIPVPGTYAIPLWALT